MPAAPDAGAAPEPSDLPEDAVEVRCYFVRRRNALLVRAQFTPVYTDLYLHLADHRLRYGADGAELLKDGLAALVLHLASRPWNEAIAWTMSWQDPLLNLFVTGSNRDGTVTGRVFTEDVRRREKDLFHSQTSVAGEPSRQSIVELADRDCFAAGESYYGQSEQRPGRYFHLGDEDHVLLAAQPDCDLDWFHGLDDDDFLDLDRKEELSLLERRRYRFHCGCSQEKLLPLVAGMSESTLEEVFGEREVIPASCPRCGARYAVTREAIEAYLLERA